MHGNLIFVLYMHGMYINEFIIALCTEMKINVSLDFIVRDITGLFFFLVIKLSRF